MGMTAPQPYTLADGRVVTPANPALVWAHPTIMMEHDRQVVARLLGSGRGQNPPDMDGCAHAHSWETD